MCHITDNKSLYVIYNWLDSYMWPIAMCNVHCTLYKIRLEQFTIFISHFNFCMCTMRWSRSVSLWYAEHKVNNIYILQTIMFIISQLNCTRFHPFLRSHSYYIISLINWVYYRGEGRREVIRVLPAAAKRKCLSVSNNWKANTFILFI